VWYEINAIGRDYKVDKCDMTAVPYTGQSPTKCPMKSPMKKSPPPNLGFFKIFRGTFHGTFRGTLEKNGVFMGLFLLYGTAVRAVCYFLRPGFWRPLKAAYSLFKAAS
jgi:hypothetical protein